MPTLEVGKYQMNLVYQIFKLDGKTYLKIISEVLLGVNFLYAHKSINKKNNNIWFFYGCNSFYWVAALG